MVNIHADYAAMQATVGTIAGGRGEIASILDRLKSDAQALTDSGFRTSKASATFWTTYESLDSKLRLAFNDLEQMEKYLNQAMTTLSQADESIAASIQAQ